MEFNRAASRRRRTLVLLTALIMAMGVFAPQIALAVTALEIQIDEFINDDTGSTHDLESGSVPDEFVGQACTVESIAGNQQSVHLNNDFIVNSGGSQVTLPNVERAPGAITTASDPLVLGDTVNVDLFLGSADGIFSGEFTIVIDCPETPPPAGRIIVVKEVTDGSDTTQSFEFSASYDADGFSLSDGQQNDSGDLVPGTYSVSETVPDGWTLESAVCDDQSAPNQIDLAAGETVTCTFTNDEDPTPPPPDPGRIIVVKQVTDGSTTLPFQFTASYDADGFSLAHGQQNVSPDLAAGVYTVFETLPDGWTLVSAECDDQSTPDEINLSAGETVTCTFVNEIPTDVGASILVTVGSTCTVSGTQGVGRIDVTMSVAGGADVVVRNSAGDVVGSLSADGTIEVPEGEVYTWVATPNPGFEFPAGFDNTGSVTIENCSNPDVLPFTGIDTDWLAALGIVLLMAGGMTLITARTSPQQKS